MKILMQLLQNEAYFALFMTIIAWIAIEGARLVGWI
jgi:hypothetical protein